MWRLADALECEVRRVRKAFVPLDPAAPAAPAAVALAAPAKRSKSKEAGGARIADAGAPSRKKRRAKVVSAAALASDDAEADESMAVQLPAEDTVAPLADMTSEDAEGGQPEDLGAPDLRG